MKLTTRDKYLRKNFEITEAEFDEAFTDQGSVCKCCSRPPTTKSLHVDHDHKIEKWKVSSRKAGDRKWVAWPSGEVPDRLAFSREGRTKSEAIAAVKKVLKRLSVRGVVCWRCNTGFKKFNDNADSLYRASQYFAEYNNFLTTLTNFRNGFTE